MVPHFGTRILLNFDCDSLQAITVILLFSIYFESMKWSIFCLKSLSGHSKKETQWLACEFLMRSAKAQDSRAQNTLSLSYSQQRVQREAKALANPERSGRSLQLASAKQCVPRNRDIFECPTDVKFSFKMHSLWIGVAQRQFPKAIPLVRSLQGCFPHWNVHEKNKKHQHLTLHEQKGQQLDSLSKYEWFSPTDVSSVTLALWVNDGQWSPLLESNPSISSRFPIKKTLYLKRKFPLPRLITGNGTLIQ